jgi:hypothetical protein
MKKMKFEIEITKDHIIVDKGDGYPSIYSMELYDEKQTNFVYMAIISSINTFLDNVPKRWIK